MTSISRLSRPALAVTTLGAALILLIFLLAVASRAAAHTSRPALLEPTGTILHAAPIPQGTQDCSSWANQCSLQAALALATAGDQIWVSEGVHHPGPARSDSFTLKSGVAIYGGFSGDENALDERDPSAHPTVLSGDVDQNDQTNPQGVITTTAHIVGGNAYHVVIGSGVNQTAVLDGFILTGGQANGVGTNPCTQHCGGGLYISGGSPTLANLVFSGNYATLFGGGLYNRELSSPHMSNVTFQGNQAQSGGGMHNDGGCKPVLVSADFRHNHATLEGGGMLNRNGSDATLTNVVFRENSAAGTSEGGGGMFNSQSSPTLLNVIFEGNRATGSDSTGGGMSNWGSHPRLTQVVFSGNAAVSQGGGMVNWASAPHLINVTFSGNRAAAGGGMLNSNSSYPEIRNTIIWGNLDSEGAGSATASLDRLPDDNSMPQISYSLIEGCNPGGVWNAACGNDTETGSNVPDADPRFVQMPDATTAPTTAGNLRLQGGSPALDKGNNVAIGAVSADLDGNPRIVGGKVDLGPWEAAWTLQVGTQGQGSVTIAPHKPLYGWLEPVVLTAVPQPGWSFAGWSGSLTSLDNPYTPPITGNLVLTATFTEDAYTLTIQTVGQGSVTVTPQKEFYRYGDVVTLHATPATNWRFDTWLGAISGTTNPITHTITADTTIAASFSRHTWQLFLPVVVRD